MIDERTRMEIATYISMILQTESLSTPARQKGENLLRKIWRHPKDVEDGSNSTKNE